jgi:drug/metabolite transporter (DMT)-like permease
MRSALFMAIAMAGFTTSDAVSKYVIGDISFGQLLFVRGVMATAIIALIAWKNGLFSQWRGLMHKSIGWRCVGELGATLSFMAALSHMPLANINAVNQALPLAVTMCAALFLKETVGWRRWIAIAVGFSGVMIVVRPGMEGFTSWSLLALLCVAFCALRDLATHSIPQEIPSLLVSTLTAAIVTVAGGLLIVPLGGWAPVSGFELGLMGAAAIILLFGYHFLIMSMRVGDISFVAPFRYTGLLWAILLGFLVFGDIPDAAMILGSSIIVGSGVYTLYRERKRGGERPAAESTGPSMGPDGL